MRFLIAFILIACIPRPPVQGVECSGPILYGKDLKGEDACICWQQGDGFGDPARYVFHYIPEKFCFQQGGKTEKLYPKNHRHYGNERGDFE